MKLAIPESQLPALAGLMSLSKEERTRFEAALAGTSVSLNPEKLTQDLATRAALPAPDVEKLLWLLYGLYLMTDDRRESPQVIAEEICVAAREVRRPDIDFSGATREFQDALGRMLGMHQTLGVFAKGFDLLMEHERTLVSVRILTDVRPLFGPDPTAPPLANLVSHNLKCEYSRGVDNRSEEFFIALDSKDLHQLRSALDRALAKEETLVQDSRARGIPLLRVGSE